MRGGGLRVKGLRVKVRVRIISVRARVGMRARFVVWDRSVRVRVRFFGLRIRG